MAVVGAVALTVAALAFLQWRDGLRLFGSVGDEIGQDPLAVGRTLFVGEMVDPVSDGSISVRVESIRPVITANTAHASIRVLMCTMPSSGDAGIGSAYTLKRSCATVSPFVPGTFSFSGALKAGTAMAVVAITPHTDGHVHIAGIDIAFQQGLRHGDQRTGIEIDTRTPGP